MAAIKAGYEKKRLEEAEALYLTPTGWDVETFKDAADKLPDYGEIRSKMGEYSLPVELMVAGFSEGLGYIFSLNGTGAQKGLIQRHDIPGFYAIGSGSYGALYMMYYREMSFREKARAAAYYVMEAKLFGEQAGGVGEGTDMYCETADGKFICFDEEGTIEKKFIRVWSKLRPKWFGKESVELLNSIPELDGFELIEAEAKPSSSKKTTPRDTNTGDSK